MQNKMKIDAQGLHYRLLNEKIHEAIKNGAKKIILDNVCGQRYIGDGIKGDIEIEINGIPGNDLAAFMDGPRIKVFGNAQDGIGNTMNSGEIIVHGDAGDIVGHSMRGGRIFVKGDVGYRVGIHMKAYLDMFPVVVIGGCARDFFGEYMAGGMLILLGLNSKHIVGDFIGCGMHSGSIFIRGDVDAKCLGKEVKIAKPNENDILLLNKHIGIFADSFRLSKDDILRGQFIKLYPYTHRPYGRLYAY